MGAKSLTALISVAVAAAALLLAPAGGAAGGRGGPWLPPVKSASAVIWAVGDGADGGAEGLAVAEMLDSRRVDRFLYLGDVYANGTASEFQQNYAPAFGRFADRTAPTIGNHEWGYRFQGYLPYWRDASGHEPPPWYAIKASGWQLLSLNSMAPHAPGSSQLRWLGRRLNKWRGFGSCRIAFMHHPRFSASKHGDDPTLTPLWQRLQGRAELVLAGHDHAYQRFHPVGGLEQLVVGTGGSERYPVRPDARLAYSNGDIPGALRIVLRGRKAHLAFFDVSGAVLDSSTVRCDPGRS